MTVPILEATDLGVDFPVGGGIFARARTLHAVRDVSLALPAGGALGIVGESGCGKSTLAMALLNLQPSSQGRVLLDGIDIRDLPRAVLARRIQPIFQDPYSSLNPTRSIGESILQPLRIHGIGDRAAQRAEMLRVMELVGLPARLAGNFPDQLSGGQRQRVAIARALIMRPGILVCDEPTSALDVSVQSQILNLLADLRRELGLACIFISHNLAVIEHVADEVAVMYLGRVIEQAPTQELFAQPRHPYTAALLAAILTPDPSLGIPEVMASGEYPDPLAPPSGCPFHPRCPHVMPVCRSERPEFRAAGATRVACHLVAQ